MKKKDEEKEPRKGRRGKEGKGKYIFPSSSILIIGLPLPMGATPKIFYTWHIHIYIFLNSGYANGYYRAMLAQSAVMRQ